MSDRSIREALVKLLTSETSKKNWSDLAELPGYDNYYWLLQQSTQQIAATSQSQQPWRALVGSNYNEESAFGRWLSAEPKARPALLEAIDSSYPVVRKRSLIVLADSCASHGVACDQIRRTLRGIAGPLQPDVAQYDAVAVLKGLALCGTLDDIPLLDDLQRRSTNRSVEYYVKAAEEQIRRRPTTQSDAPF